MCWYAHDYDEIRHKDSDIFRFMEDIILPKYTKIKAWELIKPVGISKERQAMMKLQQMNEKNASIKSEDSKGDAGKSAS
jgi:hypothetical protein